MAKIHLTGANGYVGSLLLNYLIAADCIVIPSLSEGDIQRSNPPGPDPKNKWPGTVCAGPLNTVKQWIASAPAGIPSLGKTDRSSRPGCLNRYLLDSFGLLLK